MRVSLLFVALLGLLFVLPTPSSADPDTGVEATTVEKGTIDLKYRTYRKWKFRMPVTGFAPVSGKFDFTAGGGGTFDAELEGEGLKVDLDGNDEHDVTVKGDSGFVTLERKNADGETTFKYAARLVGGDSGWMYAPGGAMVGKIGDTKVQLIDQNGNGCYADIGRDAIVVGHSKVASFLSETINVGGALYDIKPAKDGKTLAFETYTGPEGVLDIKSDFDSNAKLLEFVIMTMDQRLSFDLTLAPKTGLKVPAATYLLHKGTLGLGNARAAVVHGKAKLLTVAHDETTTFAWGGPIEAQFAVQMGDGEVGFDPGQMRFYGRGGEQYLSFAPFGKSPEFTIVDAKDKSEIATAIFTGC